MRETLRNKRGSGGFTLVELLITIVIIGVLAAVVVLAIGGLTNTGKQSACKATADAAHAAATSPENCVSVAPASAHRVGYSAALPRLRLISQARRFH